MFLGTVLSALMVAITVAVHYEVLRWTSDFLPRLTIHPRARIVIVIFAVFFAHTIEVYIWATAFYLMTGTMGLGGFAGEFHEEFFREYVYYSAVSYTSLGLGDVWPTGAIRLLTGVEALTGLVMIGWSVSFTFLAMQRFWDLHPPRGSREKSG